MDNIKDQRDTRIARRPKSAKRVNSSSGVAKNSSRVDKAINKAKNLLHEKEPLNPKVHGINNRNNIANNVNRIKSLKKVHSLKTIKENEKEN